VTKTEGWTITLSEETSLDDTAVEGSHVRTGGVSVAKTLITERREAVELGTEPRTEDALIA
jgi:hypothetical protein